MRFRGVIGVAALAVAAGVSAGSAGPGGEPDAAPVRAGGERPFGSAVAAGRTVGEGAAPLRGGRPLPLAEHAGPADQWILDRLARRSPDDSCPLPGPDATLVLDTDGRSRALVLWILDSREFCEADITVGPSTGYEEAHGTLDEAFGSRAENFEEWGAGAPRTAFFRGADEPVVLRGDEEKAYGPLRQWRIDLGARGALTVVTYPLLDLARVRLPVLCTASGKDCRPGY